MILLLTFSSVEEKEKFEYIYENYKNLLLYTANNILKDFYTSEDAVSEAFIRIYKNIHKIDDPTSNQSVAFIVTITRNVALTMYGKEKKYIAEDIEDNIYYQDDFDLENFIVSEISSEEIYTIVNQLDEEYRDVFLLKYSQDLSHKEIADILRITENNVTVRLHRARKKLSDILIKEGYGSGEL